LNFREQKKNDFIFRPSKEKQRTPQKSRGGEEWDRDKHRELLEEIAERNLDEKFRATTSAICRKEVRDPETIYFVIEIEKGIRIGSKNTLIEKLSAKVHDYLDEKHTTLLVSVPASIVKQYEERELPLPIKEPLLDIRELRYEEQVSKGILKDSEWMNSPKAIIVHTIPNIDETVAQKYMAEIKGYFQKTEHQVIWIEEPKQGMLLAKIKRAPAEELLKKTNIVYRLEALPIGVATSSTGKKFRIKGKVSSLTNNWNSQSIAELPIVCISDTGVNSIPQISSIIYERNKEDCFADLDDSHPEGHGTPIAYLVSFGEDYATPRARVISHKIFSEQFSDVAFEGMLKAIKLYSTKCRIFSSSIVFDDADALSAYAKLDKLIQEKNICFVSAAGNINNPLEQMNSVGHYPSYINSFPVLYPAQNTHVIGVGAITRKEKSGSIAPKDCLSPITRCGKSLRRLYDSKKPDIVEHGGNMCYDGTSIGIGVSSFCKTGTPSDTFIGTSFSAPLIAGRLAEIVAKYGNQIRNSETLKAILFMSCDHRESTCFGNGIPHQFLTVNENNAVFVFEGFIRLSDLTSPSHRIEYYSRIAVPVPAGVKQIDMCLVHSDNYSVSEPTLDTYLYARAWKAGRPSSPVPPDNKDELHKKEYVKFLRWSHKRKSMQGTWDFDIVPETSSFIDNSTKKNVLVRYGCVILLTAETGRFRSLTEDCIAEMNRWK
jgi:hypothetical protein